MTRNTMKNDSKAQAGRDLRRRELLLDMGRLLQELSDLDLEDSGVPVHKEGARVKITRKDAYEGRLGTLIGRHGQVFWNVRLDRLGDEPMNKIIYKKPKFLEVLPEENSM
jgi:hypothetical protein